MAKKSKLHAQNRPPKFASRGCSSLLPVRSQACFYARLPVMCRLCFREAANEGLIPGVRKYLGNSMVTDPIADFLIRLQNASKVNKESVSNAVLTHEVFHWRRCSRRLAISARSQRRRLCLPASHSQSHFRTKTAKPAITGAKRISKPSRRCT